MSCHPAFPGKHACSKFHDFYVYVLYHPPLSKVAPGAPASAGNGQATSVMLEPADPELHCTSQAKEFKAKDFWTKANAMASSYPQGLKQQIRLLGLSLVGALTQGVVAFHWVLCFRDATSII